MGDPNRSQPKWINPCGLDLAQAVHDPNVQSPNTSDLELLDAITAQVRIAWNQADQFKDEFADKVFKTNLEELHESWKGTDYEWLPNQCKIPKNLSEPTPEEHLQGLTLDEALLDTYQYLQMIAVGLEQVVWDQEREDGPFFAKFNESEYRLRLVLCEIQMTIYNKYIKMRPDITRDSMPDDVRSLGDASGRNLRDWIIYRDYMNTLEYVKDVFEYFKHKP